MNEHIQDIKDSILPFRKLLLNHPVYQQMRHLDDLKILMEQHVFAVWDFMALPRPTVWTDQYQCPMDAVETPDTTPD